MSNETGLPQAMHPIYALAEAKINEIESELKKLGRWSAESAPAGALEKKAAFGEGVMSFEQWIQWVLIPRVRGIVAEHGEIPIGSMVGVYAMRVIGADPEAGDLDRLLREFDKLFNEYKPDLDWGEYLRKIYS